MTGQAHLFAPAIASWELSLCRTWRWFRKQASNLHLTEWTLRQRLTATILSVDS